MGKSEKKSDIVYKEIKRMIIEGELKPMTDISEDEFSRHFQTSRTPVHEAIMKLEEEGFVYVYPRKGTFVSAISLAEMQHVYEIRMLTEPTLIRHACKVISDEKLDELKAQLTISTEHMSEAEYIKYFTDLDNKLHTMILECSDNEFIKVAMYRAYDHQHRARIRIASTISFHQATDSKFSKRGIFRQILIYQLCINKNINNEEENENHKTGSF